MGRLLDERIDDAVRIIFAGSGYLVGEFDCLPDDWRWRTENCIGARPHVVFPRTPVWITPAGSDRFLATANHLLVYDPDVLFRRRLASQAGDRCLFVLVDEDLADELWLTRPARVRPRLRE